jgi:hypothetical protein
MGRREVYSTQMISNTAQCEYDFSQIVQLIIEYVDHQTLPGHRDNTHFLQNETSIDPSNDNSSSRQWLQFLRPTKSVCFKGNVPQADHSTLLLRVSQKPGFYQSNSKLPPPCSFPCILPLSWTCKTKLQCPISLSKSSIVYTEGKWIQCVKHSW